MKNYIKANWQTESVPLIVITAMTISSFYFYHEFPAKVPTHWNYLGQIDAWSSRTFGAFMMPIITMVIYTAMLLLPNADPHKGRYAEFAKQYHGVKSALVVFMASLYLIMALAGLDIKVPVDFFVPFGIGILMTYLGLQMKHVKRNYFFGIRTPWSLSSDKVWNETHRVGGMMFTVSGVLMMLSGMLPSAWKLIVFLLTLAISIVATIYYSYYSYIKENKK